MRKSLIYNKKRGQRIAVLLFIIWLSKLLCDDACHFTNLV